MSLISVSSSFLLLQIIFGLISENLSQNNNVAPEILGNNLMFPMRNYEKAHSYTKNSKAFGNYTLQDTIRLYNELATWQAPRELQEKFPFYHSGYDKNDQPVWIGEIGKFDISAQVRRGPESTNNLTQYIFQAAVRIMESMIVKDTPTKEVRRIFGIADWQGFDITQITHLPTVRYLLQLARDYGDFLELAIDQAKIINGRYTTFLFFDSIRPILGSAAQRIEIFYKNKTEWQDVLHRILPANVIPPWYGGSKDYKPIQVLG